MTDLSYGPPAGRRKRIFLALLALLAAYLVWEAVTWPDVGALTHSHPRTTAFIEKYRGWGILGPKKKVEWAWVPYERISPSLKRAVLVNEDMRFFSHNGFDEEEIKASLQDAWSRKSLPRGASTITQQVAKNLWLSGSYNPLRKVKEAILTHELRDPPHEAADPGDLPQRGRIRRGDLRRRGRRPPLLPPLGGRPLRPPGSRASPSPSPAPGAGTRASRRGTTSGRCATPSGGWRWHGGCGRRSEDVGAALPVAPAAGAATTGHPQESQDPARLMTGA